MLPYCLYCLSHIDHIVADDLALVQDRIRQLHRELLKQVKGLYNTPRLVDMLVHGLASKNNRTRVEAAEAIGEIIREEGVSVTDKARQKPLPALAQVSPALNMTKQLHDLYCCCAAQYNKCLPSQKVGICAVPA